MNGNYSYGNINNITKNGSDRGGLAKAGLYAMNSQQEISRAPSGQANMANIGIDSEKFGNHYKNLGVGTAGSRLLKGNE